MQVYQYERASVADEEKNGYVVIEHFHTDQLGFGGGGGGVGVCLALPFPQHILQLVHEKTTTYPLIFSLGYFLSRSLTNWYVQESVLRIQIRDPVSF
jgi:hypothetical protein